MEREESNNPQINSLNEFCEREDDDVKSATKCEMKCHCMNKDDQVFEWNFLKDDENIN